MCASVKFVHVHVLVELFDPSDDVRKMVDEMGEIDPVPLEELTDDEH